MRTGIKRLLVTAAFGFCLAGFARADLVKRIDEIISRPAQKKVRFSIYVVEANSGKMVYNHDADTAMAPASNMKIITTAAALRYLGPDYKYTTKVGLCGDMLAVVGSGDPLLGDRETDAKYGRKINWIFEDIAAVLKRNAVTGIKGIIVDTSIFDDQRVHPNWPREQLNRPYACEISGLNFNGNCIEVSAKTVGSKVAVSIDPETEYVKVINKVVPSSKGKSAVGSYRQPEPNKITVFGDCRKEAGPFAVAVENPAAFFAFLLQENLTKAGIKTEGQFVEKVLNRDCDFKMLAEYTTPIADCLTRCNKDSFGLAAEALLKTIAVNREPTLKAGSWTKGREVVSQYILQLDVDKGEFYVDDGSGLSRENRLSANAITKVLLDVYRSKNWPLYESCLAVGGVEGTIGKYFKEEKYKNKVLGKTGYIQGVKSFSGICKTAKGDYLFSILTDGANGQTRETINDIAKMIIDEAESAKDDCAIQNR